MKKWLLTGALSATLAAQANTQPLPAPLQQLEKKGIEIVKPFTAADGSQAWVGKYQGSGVTLYLTPDKQHVITGFMYDAQGNNLSEKVINEEIYLPAGREMWQKLLSAPGIEEGSASANCKVVVFADPFCPYCTAFWHQVQPLLKQNAIGTRTLLVGVIRPESEQYAAAILSSADPEKTWYEYEMSKGKAKPEIKSGMPAAVTKQIAANEQLMNELGAGGTPAIYYLNKDNALQQIIGAPNASQLADLAACK